MENTSVKLEDIKLPDGYDFIDDYQKNTEQNVVDNLFDYFGHVYYKNYDGSTIKKARNHYISKHDIRLFHLLDKRILRNGLLALIFGAIAIVGYVLYYFFVGPTFGAVQEKVQSLIGQAGIDKIGWEIIIYGSFVLTCFFALLAIIFFGFFIYWIVVRAAEQRRVDGKIKDWNQVFYNFSHNLTKSGIHNAIQASIPDLVLDKHTPRYDRKSYNLHSRVYTYADIPRDARKIEFKNLFSGFYKGSPFSVSYSAWEWFREAKEISQKTDSTGHKVFVNVKRKLRRFEDKICVLSIDSYAESKLNFVLSNPDGKNIRLQNKIFNNVFTLAVNNPKLAYTVFTPYVQHSLARCKTWSDAGRAIRNVIKEGNKIYVIFDGKSDFFNFERITNPELNYVFNSRHEYTNVIIGGDRRIQGKRKKFAIGSLDEAASLMTEYILEELDILFTALEMGSCYPLDDALLEKAKSKKTLYDILDEKREANLDHKYKIVGDIRDRFSEIPIADVELRNKFMPTYNNEKITLKKDKQISDSISPNNR